MSKCGPFFVRTIVSALLMLASFSSLSYAVTPDRISSALRAGSSVTLRGNVHKKALPMFDKGLADPYLRFESMTLLTVPTVSQRNALTKLVAEQQDQKSPNYHKWCTPEQWAERFGLSRNDMSRITTWLKGQGFTGIRVARGRNWVAFSGTAAQVQSAFGTEIHRYDVNGELHVANATAPRVPAALAGVVTGIRGLDDFYLRPRSIAARVHPNFNTPSYASLIAPGDIKAIYDITALTGIDGTGQKLAVIGQTDVDLADLNNFRTGFQLPSLTCTTNSNDVITACSDAHFVYTYVPNGSSSDPGQTAANDLTEADLDLEWAGAIAPGAQIIYVNSPVVHSGTTTSGGVWNAWYYAVDQNLASVISLSYGTCEFYDNNILDPTTGNDGADEVELKKANSLGITFVNSSGDAGPAECDNTKTTAPNNLALNGYAVSYPASSPEVTGVGGTAIDLPNIGNATYWGNTNATDGGTALGYIPEIAWNDDDELSRFCTAHPSTQFCTNHAITNAQSVQSAIGMASSGGGPSNCATQTAGFSACVSAFPAPTFQSSLSISGQTSPTRFTPDVSLLASADFPGYVFCTQLSELGQSGTGSACASGIQTAVDNYVSIVGGTSASTPVFAGMVTLLNQFLASSPGLGNINPMLYQFAATPGNFHPVNSGTNQVYCSVGTPGTPQPPALWCPSSGALAGILGFDSSVADSKTGYNLVTGLGSVDLDKLATAWAASQTSFTMGATALNPTSVSAGTNTSSTITITPVNGFSGTVSFGCSGLPTGASCSFNPATASSANGWTTTLTITTLPNMAKGTTMVTVNGTSAGAPSVSTSLSLVVTATGQSFTLSSNLTGSTLAVNQGASGVVNITVASTTGFVVISGGNSATTLPVTYSCSGLPNESQCLVSPNTTTSATSVSVTITTTAPIARLAVPSSRSTRIFYAALLPGLFGIMFTLGSRKRSLRGMRMLGLIMVLGASTMWLGSCGGSNNSSSSNSGTPKGNSSVTINATTGGASPITASLPFTLSVQ